MWLTPLLTDAAVSTAVSQAQQPTLLVGGRADSLWRPPAVVGSGVRLLEAAGADHGLQQPGSWRDSLLGQVAIFDQIGQLAAEVLLVR